MTAPVRRGPGKAGYVIGSLLLVGGIAVGIIGAVVGVSRIVDTIDRYQRIPVHSGLEGRTIVLPSAGRYSVFYEAPGVTRVSEIPPITVQIVGPDGAVRQLTTDYSGTSQTYQFTSRQGARLGQFTADVAGTYRVRVLSDPSVANAPYNANLAIGRGDVLGGLGVLGLGLVLGGVIALVGVVVLIVTAVRRSNHRKQGQPQWPQPWTAPPPAWANAPLTGWAQPPAGWGPGPPPAGAWPPQAPPQPAPSGPGAWPPAKPPVAPAPGAWPPPTPPEPPEPAAPGSGPWPPPSDPPG